MNISEVFYMGAFIGFLVGCVVGGLVGCLSMFGGLLLLIWIASNVG